MARIADFLNRKFSAINPVEEIGIGGFVLFARVRDAYSRQIDIPMAALENGSVVSDHFIVRPIAIQIEGDVSDVHLRPSPIVAAFRRLQAEVGNLTGQYASSRTQAQLSRVSAIANSVADAVARIDAALDAGEQALNFFGNRDSTAISLQRQFLDKMESYMDGRQLITIEMPNRVLQNMAIERLTTNTDNQVNATSFTLEARQIQFADLQFVEVQGASNPAPGLDGQTAPQTDRGIQSGTPVEDASLLSKILDAVN